MPCYDLPLTVLLHPDLSVTAAVLTGTLAPFYRPRWIGGYDPDRPVTVNPNLAIPVSKVTLLDCGVGNVSK
jgi:hypothetical protein